MITPSFRNSYQAITQCHFIQTPMAPSLFIPPSMYFFDFSHHIPCTSLSTHLPPFSLVLASIFLPLLLHLLPICTALVYLLLFSHHPPCSCFSTHTTLLVPASLLPPPSLFLFLHSHHPPWSCFSTHTTLLVPASLLTPPSLFLLLYSHHPPCSCFSTHTTLLVPASLLTPPSLFLLTVPLTGLTPYSIHTTPPSSSLLILPLSSSLPLYMTLQVFCILR